MRTNERIECLPAWRGKAERERFTGSTNETGNPRQAHHVMPRHKRRPGRDAIKRATRPRTKTFTIRPADWPSDWRTEVFN